MSFSQDKVESMRPKLTVFTESRGREFGNDNLEKFRGPRRFKFLAVSLISYGFTSGGFGFFFYIKTVNFTRLTALQQCFSAKSINK